MFTEKWPYSTRECWSNTGLVRQSLQPKPEWRRVCWRLGKYLIYVIWYICCNIIILIAIIVRFIEIWELLLCIRYSWTGWLSILQPLCCRNLVKNFVNTYCITAFFQRRIEQMRDLMRANEAIEDGQIDEVYFIRNFVNTCCICLLHKILE